MKAVEIKPDIYWVGAVDWAVRDFHGYETPHGTTYNNYLIMDDEVTLVDTVREEFAATTVDGIRGIVDPSRIRRVIVNHIENDHMGALDRIMALCPEATIHVGKRGLKGMERFFDVSKWNVETITTGDELKLGRYTLSFIETSMLHWPDSIVTCVKEAKLLFSQDAFGQHYASTSRFDDEFAACASAAELEDAVVDYYANILMPFGSLIKKTISSIRDSGIPIDMIAPDHGVIWREDPEKVIRMYLDMADGKAEARVALVYDTMWHGTEMMNQPIVQGIKDEGLECKVIKLRNTPMSAAVKELWKSRGFLVGSPTLNNEMFPSVAAFMTYLRGLRPRSRIASAYGTFGWGGGAVKKMLAALGDMKLELVEPGLEVQYRPLAEDKEKCYEFGREFARRIKAYRETSG